MRIADCGLRIEFIAGLRKLALRASVSLCLIFFFGVSAFADDYPEAAQDKTIIETVLRLEGFDLNSSAKAKAAVLRYLQHDAGSEQFFSLVRKFQLAEADALLVKLASEKSGDTAGVEAARLLVMRDDKKPLLDVIEKGDAAAAALIDALGLTGDTALPQLLLPVIADEARPLAVRSAAARAVGRQIPGQKELVALAAAGKLAADLHFTVANVLHASPDAVIRAEAAKHLKLPATASAEPLPPLAALIAKNGDAAHGREVFRTKGTCANCHKVAGEGKEVGPDLSEIGSKLSREAMFVAILNPSEAISHNFETYQAILADGSLFAGILVSQTDDAVTLRSAEAITRTIARSELEELIKQKVSLMPANLQKAMSVQELVDVTAFLTTLKKSGE
jgi:putative heme-binding domain-containing protein